ncbi:hypothetical protein Pcac1_g1710 [Phytophthora cactorum]|nr:hypothetical protein Pcac1_g1710 [Phytophthora cactorum]
MELIDNLRNAVLQQREHEVTNFFTNVNELREFISAREPAAGVNITVKMCCYNCEILSADTGSRITLVSWSAHAMFEEVREALNELNSVNRKPFIAQVTVWDSKKKVGSPKTGRLHFRVGAVYEFKQVHSVGYFSDIAKGSVQLEDGASDVDAANTESLLANDVPIVHINALHHVQQKRLHQKREIPEGTVCALTSEATTANNDRDRVVATKLILCVGAPVTLTLNLEQSAGLCNGTNGIIDDLIFFTGSDLPIILIKVTDLYLGPSFLKDVPNIVPIVPREITWGKKNSDLRVVRRGIPLRLAYAMTIHKVQGVMGQLCAHYFALHVSARLRGSVVCLNFRLTILSSQSIDLLK